MINDRLLNLGITDQTIKEASLYKDCILARVVGQYKDLYKVAIENGEIMAEISGKLRYLSDALPDYPAVGDFVVLDREDGLSGNAIIQAILSRKSIFIRRAAGTTQDVQVIAANIDTVFICMSLNNDFNLRRLERYLAITWDSGAIPVVVLTKSDLCLDLQSRLSEVEGIAAGVEIIVTTSMSEDGYKAITEYIRTGQTVAFLGSSGVGKSTLINRLLGEDFIKTKEIRKDDKGRHTTTTRELILIPTGGAVIDTPGMRELGVESANLAKAFSDIDDFAMTCRFDDCQHEREPGCAVRQAIQEGLISEERLASYQKLKKEAKYDGLNSKQIEKEKMTTMFADFGGIKNAKAYVKSKGFKQNR